MRKRRGAVWPFSDIAAPAAAGARAPPGKAPL